MKHIKLLFCAMAFLIFYPSWAYSYLDPGAGNIVLQVLLGGVVGVIAIFKLYWSQIKGFWSIRDADEVRRGGGREPEA
jgi:hypothetical protein